MFDFIKNHAIENVWCTPDQDTQMRFEPTRITPPTGAIISYKVLQKLIDLPDVSSYWNLYQIGQVHPLLLGLFPKVNEWVSFADTCNSQKMICDVYLNNGIQLPRFETFYMYSNDRDLIIAVKKNNKIPFNFSTDKVFLRVYSNEYFNSDQSDALNDKIVVYGKRISSTQDIINLQLEVKKYDGLNGFLYSFVNGYKVGTFNLTNVTIGDVTEFVFDSSISKVIDFKIGDLNTFESELDSKNKYLLHYLGVDNTIQYHDDIDFFIIDRVNNVDRAGVFFHKNVEDAVRMVTHRDYSIVVAYVLGYVDILQASINDGRIIDPEDLIIRLHIRSSGYNRSLIYENNRIKELYKMTDIDVVRAMVGIDSVVPNWKAATLEKSGYTQIMRSKYNEITNLMVQNGYGYNSMSRIIGDTPNKTHLSSSKQVVEIPYGLQSNSTVYEYDGNGVLLGYHYHSSGSVYSAVNNSTRVVEIISGKGTNVLSDKFGRDNIPVPTSGEFRVYACNYANEQPDNKWKDITGDDSYYILNGKVKWTDPTVDPYIRVKDTTNFLCYDVNVQANLGSIRFSLDTYENREGVINEHVMQVPMGELDLFLNGKSLIPNLDYFFIFPEIVIINKEYLIDPLTKTQNIHIRFTGFCDKNLNLTQCTDVGFIKYGFLSNNNKFDIRDDKVLRIVVDGKLKQRSDVLFSEENSGVSIINSINGKPYSIRDIVVPLNGLVTSNTYDLRTQSIAVDKAVSDYLSLKVPQPPRNGTNVITARYQVFSPFICKIIYDLNIGTLSDTRLLSNFSDNVVLDICKPYESLLNFDPITEECAVNNEYVIIHPHNLFSVIELDFFGYRFVERVVKLYAKGLVNLSPFLKIKAATST